MDYIRLSKTMSHALRHKPERLGLTLDPEGFVDADLLAERITQTGKFDRKVTSEDFKYIIATAEKQRFELRGNSIRAMYGHSVNTIVKQTPARPPEKLYHGTAHKFVDAIRAEGLKPMNRQYVHCSPTPEWAELVGSRRDSKPVFLVVHARAAHAAGVPFYTCNDQVWLSGPIPPEFIDFE